MKYFIEFKGFIVTNGILFCALTAAIIEAFRRPESSIESFKQGATMTELSMLYPSIVTTPSVSTAQINMQQQKIIDDDVDEEDDVGSISSDETHLQSTGFLRLSLISHKYQLKPTFLFLFHPLF